MVRNKKRKVTFYANNNTSTALNELVITSFYADGTIHGTLSKTINNAIMYYYDNATTTCNTGENTSVYDNKDSGDVDTTNG